LSLLEQRDPNKIGALSMKDILTHIQYLLYLVTGWTVRGLIPLNDKMLFSYPQRPDSLCGLHTLLFNAFPGTFLEVNRPEREVNSSPFSFEVKNDWRYTSTPSIYLHCVHSETSSYFYS
jgi:hypothetical protein